MNVFVDFCSAKPREVKKEAERVVGWNLEVSQKGFSANAHFSFKQLRSSFPDRMRANSIFSENRELPLANDPHGYCGSGMLLKGRRHSFHGPFGEMRAHLQTQKEPKRHQSLSLLFCHLVTDRRTDGRPDDDGNSLTRLNCPSSVCPFISKERR